MLTTAALIPYAAQSDYFTVIDYFITQLTIYSRPLDASTTADLAVLRRSLQ